jgi:hypothetical protein
MRTLLIAFFFFLAGTLLQAQTAPADAVPGMAGHPDCHVYFAVMWLDGVPEGQTQQATHYGLNQPQLDWWKQEGQKRNKSLCYISQLQVKDAEFKVDCPGCAADWQKHFRWIVLEHRSDKDKRTAMSQRSLAGRDMGGSGPPGRATAGVISGGDPATKIDYEIEVVSTDAAVYEGGSPLRPPAGQDRQLFYYSAQKDKSHKDASGQVVRNDHQALQAATDFIAKNARR